MELLHDEMLRGIIVSRNNPPEFFYMEEYDLREIRPFWYRIRTAQALRQFEDGHVEAEPILETALKLESHEYVVVESRERFILSGKCMGILTPLARILPNYQVHTSSMIDPHFPLNLDDIKAQRNGKIPEAMPLRFGVSNPTSKTVYINPGDVLVKAYFYIISDISVGNPNEEEWRRPLLELAS